ncbi:MAG TPA: 2-hydroxyacyl-CoA dehydratase family protein [Spirochaetota bacterium]|nr:2-hydroxyacyl-CoA dehydratase family protein [Spirochaetota bacterium]
MELIQEFKNVVDNPYQYAKKIKEEEGKKIIGYFCTYAPEELVYAAGALPLRLFGVSENIHLADSHLQSYSCSLVRGALEEALNGNLDFLDGTVFPHTCDSIQRLSDIWRMNTNFAFFSDVVMPVKLTTESARRYMRDVIRKFKTDLEKGLGVDISDDAVRNAIAVYNSVRGYLKTLYEIRSEDPARISSEEMYYLVKGSMMMDRRTVLDLLPRIIQELRTRPAKKGNPGKRLVLAGSICNHPNIFRLIEDAGGVVVWDDLCTGSRYFEGETGTEGDLIDAIADRYSSREICPAKHISNTARGDRLLRLVKRHNAAGVMFLHLKFCDPHAWDYPYLKEALDGETIPSLLLEFEETLPPEGQLRTRFEAFIEML